ncbi:hypothetical protein [Candidatus Uabimicrobium amorphum]|uniref:Uncharacterized protein n=1 Tax=Uabimicrobium amorphum TaxID=2596890 RepID=A0A5S9IJA0_UABAM|nr:hypothetical protein [Candidatus Uabimicrobium amorphum]BBM82080.1 hypothetical protein UABAM_00423 [Candidatus Uabimicrobium amorphum]
MVYLAIVISIIILALAIPLIETLRWWRLWHNNIPKQPHTQQWSRALVFLTGISDFSDPELSTEQKYFVEKLPSLLKTDLNIATPFPYNSDICKRYTQINMVRRLFGTPLPMWVCSLHNFWQTALAVLWKRRYGKSVARCLRTTLGEIESQHTIFFVCGSAGAAIALAAIPDLVEDSNANIVIISYGGIFCFHKGSLYVTRHLQFVGEKDIWVRMWRFTMRQSWWANRFQKKAIGDCRYQCYNTGPHYHFDERGYLSLCVEPLTEKTYQQLTFEKIRAQILSSEERY